MTQELSTLMDGELEAHEAEDAIRGCCGSEELRRKWQAYHLIGDAMRGDIPARRASAERIMAAIRQEPTVLAPRRRLSAAAGRVALAAAASVATVAVVGWVAVQDRATATGPVLAKVAPAAKEVAAAVEPLIVNEYLVAHRQIPSADFYRPVSASAAAGR